MKNIFEIKVLFDEFVKENGFDFEPNALYEPLDYIINLGGKRLRPISLLLVNQMFGGELKLAVSAAYAIELFHNFSLIHDDIMDDAPLRRGKTTVHELWNTNTAILSGDAMLIYSYKFLTAACSKENSQSIHRQFSQTAIAVCEGQQMDVNFESREDVSRLEYVEMIYKKTGALLEGAMSIGALLASASEEDINYIGNFARNIGISFQLQDDILDAYGSQAAVGKQIGGDIIQNKKTILYILAMEVAPKKVQDRLLNLYQDGGASEEKISKVLGIFNQLGIKELAETLRDDYHIRAFKFLDGIKTNARAKAGIIEFADGLLERKF